jgi:hypothetical protein
VEPAGKAWKSRWGVTVGVDPGADMPGAFEVAGLGQRRRLAGTTSRSLSTTYVHSQNIGRKPASLELHYFQVITSSQKQTQRMDCCGAHAPIAISRHY